MAMENMLLNGDRPTYFRSTNDLCWRLSSCLTQLPDALCPWHPASEWLHIASSLEGITFDLSRFDAGYGWCGSADEYADKREAILSKLVYEITVFNYIWGSLETVIDGLVTKSKQKKFGKINAACLLLKEEYSSNVPVVFYREYSDRLFAILAQLPHYADLYEELRVTECLNAEGIALHTIYRIRNRFAHGAMAFPEPEEWSGTKPLDVELLQVSSRLVLLSLQMLLITFCKNRTVTIWCPPEYQNTTESQEVEVNVFLREVQIATNLGENACEDSWNETDGLRVVQTSFSDD